VTALLDTPVRADRVARARRYLMCRPDHFDVTYGINPWMDVTVPTNRDLAIQQWESLRATYLSLGAQVEVIDAVPGLPDMVFAANGGLVVDGRAYGARFLHDERHAEGPAYLDWLSDHVRSAFPAEQVNEGEGDFLLVGDLLLAGTGFRTSRAAHAEAQEALGLPVVSLDLVDPRFYHLDTAVAVLADDDIAYWPGAFSESSQRVLRRLFPDALLADERDACVLGLNAVSDGRHVVLPTAAVGLVDQLERRGYVPVGVDLSELLKAGGGAKCCTLELRG
jgi:N-dimethylarginine dimethylaminohydrolase